MLIDKGYDEIIAIRTKAFGIFRRYDKNEKVTVIEPNESLSHFLDFNADNAKLNIKRGYCDGLRVLQSLPGNHYYLKDVDIQRILQKLFSINEADLEKLSYFKRESYEKKRALFERVIPDIADHLNLCKNFTYEQFALAILEFVALRKEVERLKVYNFADFCKLVKDMHTPKSENILSKVGFDFSERKSILIEEIVKLLI